MAWYDFSLDYDGYSGFGHKDLWRMQDLGYSKAQIRGMANEAGKQKRNVRTAAYYKDDKSWDQVKGTKWETPEHNWSVADWIETNTEKGPWDYGKYGNQDFGMKDINAALDQGKTFNQISRYADYARDNSLGVGQGAEDWLAPQGAAASNYAYMDAGQRRAVDLQDRAADREYGEETWAKQQEEMRKANPQRRSQNAQMKLGNAGGVAIQRSDAFRKLGGTRSTAQNARKMFINSLNI